MLTVSVTYWTVNSRVHIQHIQQTQTGTQTFFLSDICLHISCWTILLWDLHILHTFMNVMAVNVFVFSPWMIDRILLSSSSNRRRPFALSACPMKWSFTAFLSSFLLSVWDMCISSTAKHSPVTHVRLLASPPLAGCLFLQNRCGQPVLYVSCSCYSLCSGHVG